MMLTTLYITKLNENRIWTSPDIKKPKVQKGTKMSEDEFLKYTAIVENLKNKNV